MACLEKFDNTWTKVYIHVIFRIGCFLFDLVWPHNYRLSASMKGLMVEEVFAYQDIDQCKLKESKVVLPTTLEHFPECLLLATLCFLALIVQKPTHLVILGLLSLAADIFQLHSLFQGCSLCSWETLRGIQTNTRTGSAMGMWTPVGWPAQVAAVMADRAANSSWWNQTHGWLEFNLVVLQVGR